MTFGIRKSFKESWVLFASRKIYTRYILASLIVILAVYLMTGIVTLGAVSAIGFAFAWWPILVIVGLVVLYFMAYVILVSVNLPLQTYKDKKVSIKKAFSGVWSFKMVLRAIGVLLLVGIIMAGGAGLLVWFGSLISPILGGVLAGIWMGYILVRWAFGFYVLVDKKKSVVDSLKTSHKLMKKNNGWKFLWFIILVSVISIVIQLATSGISILSPVLGQIFMVAFGIFLAPWFSLLSMSPYMQLTK